MRLLRITAVALLAVAAGLAGPLPAQAGGFAVTSLDPLPDKLEPGTAYTIGYWVLQHGSHPYEGELGTALRFTDEKGTVTSYPGTALAEPSHYAAAVVFPRAGTWRITSDQGWFPDHEIGAVTVPGKLLVQPVPAEYATIKIDYKYWGAVRPPQAAGTPVVAQQKVAADNPVAAEKTAPPPRGGSWGGVALIGGAMLAVAAGALFLTRRSRVRYPRPGPGASSP